MNPINIKDQLPTQRQRCLYWHSKHKCWYIGVWFLGIDTPHAPGFFNGYVTGYVFDGIATHWMPEPDAPEGEQ